MLSGLISLRFNQSRPWVFMGLHGRSDDLRPWSVLSVDRPRAICESECRQCLASTQRKDMETDMTERTLKVSLTAEMAENILFDIKDMSANILTDEEREKLNAFEAKIEPMVEAFGLMNKATVLYDDERVTLFEHPDHGDEAPLMAYHKEDEEFEEDTEMWEVSDVEEIVESYHAAFRGL